MKSKTIVCLLTILMLPAAARAYERQINLVGTVGMAVGNVERLIVNMGVELEVFRNFYAQVSFDNSLTGDDMSLYLHGGQVSFAPELRTQVFGMNLLGTFKLPLSRRTAWFTKAGLSYSFRSRYAYNDYYNGYGYYGDGYGSYYDYYPDPYLQEDESRVRTGLAYALGTGIEYRLSDKLALTGGGTYESLFERTSVAGKDGGRPDWVKLYIGFSYRLR